MSCNFNKIDKNLGKCISVAGLEVKKQEHKNIRIKGID